MQCIGIDGCRGGWLFTVWKAEGDCQLYLYPFLKDGIVHLSDATAIAVDMPMGLVSHPDEERTCDTLIRKELGHPFSASVFNTPCRQAVYAADYTKAKHVNKELCQKGLSVQSWNIVPKIRELDQLLNHHPSLKKTMHESHPELCFKYLNGQPLSHKKKTCEGKDERMSLLKPHFPCVYDTFLKFRKLHLKKDLADDDILDSMILALNALQIAVGNYKQFPSDTVLDKNEIRMGVRVLNV
ncbi:Predicted nuclease (RNAse H fold) [Saccharicrinis carchari]|uniref:Predicted nuclease (RNAse H fold) n=1 Tax=Saccharicrinis carchari TaxID=1168039 RepID=A0A521B816_SACCC|nr:DUF429 domain-containing protein [Saccharicrinis carchari]SMO43151.1 Predicted nuclease (RNAse H fold) [Saccharicrinis carchari]